MKENLLTKFGLNCSNDQEICTIYARKLTLLHFIKYGSTIADIYFAITCIKSRIKMFPLEKVEMLI